MNSTTQIKVVSMRGGLSAELGWMDIMCDRSSDLGNPFAITRSGTREKVIAAYREWLWENVQLAQAGLDKSVGVERWREQGLSISSGWKKPSSMKVYRELQRLVGLVKEEKSLRLVCWCFPSGCHSDVIKSCLLWMLTNSKDSSAGSL
jgi:hypothetical protein